MAIKLRQLLIKNFKLYSERKFDFEDKDLIVFDGPNGFGKTTVSDAIELLFTGRIVRYERLLKLLVDGREWRQENPLLHEGAQNGTIEIRLSFYHQNEEHIWALKNDRADEPVIRFDYFTLHVLENFDDTLTNTNKAQKDARAKVLGNNYVRDFQFIHYVEQEDTFAFLRSSEKEKGSSISYLFNTSEFNQEIKRYQKILDRLNDLIQGESGLRQRVKGLRGEVEKIEESYKAHDLRAYQRLFEYTEFEWDNEEIDFDKMPYPVITNSEDGILNRIESLVSQKGEFLKYRHNRNLERWLNDEDTLSAFYYYENFRDRLDKIDSEREFTNEVKGFKEAYKDFEVDEIETDVFELPDFLSQEQRDNNIFSDYRKRLAKIKQAWKESTSLGKTFAKIKNTRNNLLSHLQQPSMEDESETKCPLCGTEFSVHEELLQNIQQHGEELEKYHSELDKRVGSEVDEFLKFVIEYVIPELERIASELLYDQEYFEGDFFNPETFIKVDRFKKDMHKLNIQIDEQYSKVVDVNLDWRVLIPYLQGQRLDVEIENIPLDFDEVFSEFFNSKENLLESMSADTLADKRQYLAWKHSIYQSELLKVKREELSKISAQFNELKNYADKVGSLIATMKGSLSWYNKELIKDVELLFHIYSGRIIQDFQGGLGLFISNKKNNNIKFVSRPNKTYDAMFSMSTGQLCALVLSFTLALNQKYSKSKLLLIDDPVQSMDDINTAGLVEVLRNDFSDRHVLLSTHEQMMSTYIRYRFEKFNLTTTGIDLSAVVADS